MQCGDPAGVAGVPGLEHVERFRTTHLADDDAIGAQTQRGADEIGEACDSWLGAERDNIFGGATQFAGVFEDHHPLVQLGDLGQQRVHERRLARRCAAGDHDVAAFPDGFGEHARLDRRHDPGGNVVGEREQNLRWFPDRETRRD